jgi:hypothetical protein
MSEDFTNLIRRITHLYENCHTLSKEQIDRAVDGITGQSLQMVRNKRKDYVPAESFANIICSSESCETK